VSRLVIVVPLKEGTRDRAAELLEQGPPFDIELTHLSRHEIFLTDDEVIFDFETPGTEPPIELKAEDPGSHETARAWREVMAGSPRKARQAYSWTRPATG
jgi:hypothetical protein